MRIVQETSLRHFQFWSGGKDNADLLSAEQLDTIETYLEDMTPEEGWTDTAINDMFWFDFETITEWLGIDEEGNEKGSDEWAEHILEEFVKEESVGVPHCLGTSQQVIDRYIVECYLEDSGNIPDGVIDEFKGFVYDKWKLEVVARICKQHTDVTEEYAESWVEDTYYGYDDIVQLEEAIEEYDNTISIEEDE